MLNSSIGRKIQNRRRELKLTQEEFSEKTGVSINYIGMIERGVRIPKLETFIKIANVLGVSTDYLLADFLVSPGNGSKYRLACKIDQLSESERILISEVIDLLLTAENKGNQTGIEPIH